MSRFVRIAMPPAWCNSTAAKRPPGFRSHRRGVRREMRSMSSSVNSTPTSFAIAIRCRTALVDPPEAATAAVAFSKAVRVRIWDGRRSAARTCMTIRPTSSAALSLFESMAGIELKPTGDTPNVSSTMDMVFAVYCPPHAPAPGQATASS